MPSLFHKIKPIFSIIVWVSALGYFVDIYDLVLFSIVRVPSLKSIGLSGQAVFEQGVFLLNVQMIGMLVGGILWGVLADKRGRLSVLFGSIVLYSVANIANGFVDTVPYYALWRFLAGVGLAGELGAGITLVAESLPKDLRGYGTMLIASVGVAGAVFAGLIADFFDWRMNYWIGGGLGLVLLVLRFGVYESGLYRNLAENKTVSRGNFFKLFSSWHTAGRYLKCILIGMPLWYVVGILITFSPEIGKALGLPFPIQAGKALMACYLGLVIGDAASGALSQVWRSRRKAVFLFLTMTAGMILVYLLMPKESPAVFYLTTFVLGIAIGYWAVFVTIAAEQFGTNLRGTVAITVPNFVRGAVVPLTLLFRFLEPTRGIIVSAGLVGALCVGVAFWALFSIEETYGKDLDFVEL